MLQAAPRFRLPNALAAANWPSNPTLKVPNDYEAVKNDCDVWIRSFNLPFQEALDEFDLSLLAARSYPTLDRERLRTGCDLLMLLFTFNTFTKTEDADTISALGAMALDAFNNPHQPREHGEPIIGEIARQFWERAIVTATPSSQSRFIASFDMYATALAGEAGGTIVQMYLDRHRLVAGRHLLFFPCELTLDLPDRALSSAPMQELVRLAAQSLVLTHDTYAYDREQAADNEAHNIVGIITLREPEVTPDQAMQRVGKKHVSILRRFVEYRGALGEERDAPAAQYADGVARVVRGLDDWALESRWYFADEAQDVRKGLTPALRLKEGLLTAA